MAYMGRNGWGAMGLFFEEDGFSTVGVALALLISLALIFSAAQVYQLSSSSAEIQEVADAAALAAENQVAQFYVVAQVCDGVLLTQALTALAAIGAGLVFLCVPFTSGIGEDLVATGGKLLDARREFHGAAVDSLNTLQQALPLMAVASSAAVVSANADSKLGATYVGLSVLLPMEGVELTAQPLSQADAFADQVESSSGDIEEASRKAEELAADANAQKERAFMADCGNQPGYCMYERASHLAGMQGSDNPLFRTVDAWSFSVAFQRAKTYYAARLQREAPESGAADEQARSALRKRFYAFACQRMQEGYVHEDPTGSFEANFPLLPKNTDEMKATELYTQADYPVSQEGKGPVMHAYGECPGITGALLGQGSLKQRDAQHMEVCPVCELQSSGMGKVAAASTAIENGFEYHYNIVAEAAAAYQEKRKDYDKEASQVKDQVGALLDQLTAVLEQAGSCRIQVKPPGRYGAVALVAGTGKVSAADSLRTSFVNGTASLGTRVALSGATLAKEPDNGGDNVFTSVLGGLRDKVPWLSAVQGTTLLELWGGALSAYGQGQRSLVDAVRRVCSSGKLLSVSGLGPWAADALETALAAAGLQAADMSVSRPVTVNSYHLLSADGSAFSMRLLSARSQALQHSDGTLLSAALAALVGQGFGKLEALARDYAIAAVDFTGSEGGKQLLAVVLPEWIDGISAGIADSLAVRLAGLFPVFSGARQWE